MNSTHRRSFKILELLCIALCVLFSAEFTSAQQTASPYYQFDKAYEYNDTKIFKGAQVNPLLIHQNTAASFDIDELLSNESTILWEDSKVIQPKANIVYWLKTKIYGHKNFNGKHIFHVSPEMGNDLNAFKYIDCYTIDQHGQQTHQRTGTQIKVEDRKINFWATILEIDIQPTDSLDVYIRLEGFNQSYPPDALSLWHLDYNHLFTAQIKMANKSSLFNGMLGIQILFFLLLFFIERQLMYISISIFGVGILMTRAFTEFNFSSYVPFPSLINYNEMLFHLSVYTTILGGIFFLVQYLAIRKDSIFLKRVIPLYLVITLVAFLRYIFRYSFSDTGDFPTILLPAFYTFLGIFLGMYMVFSSTKYRERRKISLFIFLAVLPAILGGLLILLNNEAHLSFTVEENWISPYLNKRIIDDIFRVGVILMIATLSHNIGSRLLRLKSEKDVAVQDKINAQQIVLEEQLRTEKLEELNALKTRLYTNITHEFRTPLTVIMGINDEMSEMTKRHQIPIADQKKILHKQQLIKQNSKNLLTLVNQLLDLSRSESQQLDLQLIQGDIISYLNYLTQSFTSEVNQKDIQLEFIFEKPTLFMDYDEQKIQHIIYNLLSNAIKFTNENGKISLIVSEKETDQGPICKMIVKDNGIGIASDKLPHIFDRFYQADDSTTRDVGGSGIGLALTKDVVGLMNGDISVESTLGSGTTFTVKLPITNTAALKISAEKAIELPLDHLEETNNESEARLSLSPDDNPILLIVEDNRDVFSYLELILSQRYQIIAARNGQEGIAKAKEIIPDLIISDVMMPIKDGYELTKTLKTHVTTSHIPIILLTAKATHSDKIDGLIHGADAYLTKPFDKQELLIRLRRLFENRQVMQRYFSSAENVNYTSNDKLIGTPAIKQEQAFIDQVKAIIYSHITDNSLNAAVLAQKIGMSQSQLYRKMKAISGQTINNYIRNLRLQKSLDLLENTNMDISDIAYEVGFSSPSYYSRSFHKVYQQSPLSYRKSTA